jgi:Protein of unknown function DUF58
MAAMTATVTTRAPAHRSRVSRAWASVVDAFPWTPLGLGLGVGAALALRSFAYAQLDLVWLVAGYAAVGLWALAPVCVVAGALWLRRVARPQQVHEALVAETGTPCETKFELPALRFVPLIQVRWQWLVPADARVETRSERGTHHERVTLGDRGLHERITRRVIVEDPFGLCRIAFRVEHARSVRVLPRLAGLHHLPPLSSLSAGAELPHPMGLEDGDRLELQRYSPGDPARFIHWKVFARTRRLMVRKPERAVAVARRCAAFYVASADDDATAAVARLALERDLLGRDWTFGTDLDVEGTRRVDSAMTSLMRSVHARALQGKGLPAFVAAVEKQGPASLVVFVPAQPGPWIATLSGLTRHRHVRAVVGVDGVRAAVRRSWWARLLTRDLQPTAAVAGESLEAVVTALARAGVAVTVLDRPTGRPLAEAQRRALGRQVVTATTPWRRAS